MPSHHHFVRAGANKHVRYIRRREVPQPATGTGLGGPNLVLICVLCSLLCAALGGTWALRALRAARARRARDQARKAEEKREVRPRPSYVWEDLLDDGQAEVASSVLPQPASRASTVSASSPTPADAPKDKAPPAAEQTRQETPITVHAVGLRTTHSVRAVQLAISDPAVKMRPTSMPASSHATVYAFAVLTPRKTSPRTPQWPYQDLSQTPLQNLTSLSPDERRASGASWTAVHAALLRTASSTQLSRAGTMRLSAALNLKRSSTGSLLMRAPLPPPAITVSAPTCASLCAQAHAEWGLRAQMGELEDAELEIACGISGEEDDWGDAAHLARSVGLVDGGEDRERRSEFDPYQGDVECDVAAADLAQMHAMPGSWDVVHQWPVLEAGDF